MKNVAKYSPSTLEIFKNNKSQKIIDRLMSIDQQKNEIRDFVEKNAKDKNAPVDYEFAWKALGLDWYYFLKLIGTMGLEDLRAGLEPIDSLLTRKGNLFPSSRHFEIRIEHGLLAPNADREAYHLEVIERWCKRLGMDYNQYTGTKPNKESVKIRNNRTSTTSLSRKPVTRKHTLDNVSPESRAIILDAMKQPNGTFSPRALMQLK